MSELALIMPEGLTSHEKSDIETHVEQMIITHKHNRAVINKMTLESVTCLATSQARASELASKGIIGRSWRQMTGKHMEITADLNRNVARSQYAAQMVIQKLAEQQLMTFELVLAVNNKLQTFVYDIELEINEIYQTLQTFFKTVRSQLLQQDARMEKIEKNVSLLQWNTTIAYQSYGGTDYAELPPMEKLVCLINDFYHISKGDWSIADLMLLKATMADLGLDVKEKVTYRQFFQYILTHPTIADRLFEQINTDALSEIEPDQASIIKGIEKMKALDNQDKYICETITEWLDTSRIAYQSDQVKLSVIDHYLKSHAYLSLDGEIPQYEFAVEVLVNFQMLSAVMTIIESEPVNMLSSNVIEPVRIEPAAIAERDIESDSVERIVDTIQQFDPQQSGANDAIQAGFVLQLEQSLGIGWKPAAARAWIVGDYLTQRIIVETANRYALDHDDAMMTEAAIRQRLSDVLERMAGRIRDEGYTQLADILARKVLDAGTIRSALREAPTSISKRFIAAYPTKK